MEALLADAEAGGALLATHTRVTGVDAAAGSGPAGGRRRFVVHTQDVGTGEQAALEAACLVNAAGGVVWSDQGVGGRVGDRGVMGGRLECAGCGEQAGWGAGCRQG